MGALFSAFGVDWHLLLIQAVNFALLLAALTYFLYKPILRIIDERREKVAEGVRVAQQAQSKRLKTQNARRQDGRRRCARSGRTGRCRANPRKRNEQSETVKRAAESKADAILKDAQSRAEEEKRLAMQESSKEIARAAMLAAEKILKESNAK